jgi:hypothetical protein
MCPFLTAFRHPLILALTAAQANPDNPAPPPPPAPAAAVGFNESRWGLVL